MKTLQELQDLLLLEIKQNMHKIKSVTKNTYYNKFMGDTSIILTSILEEFLLAENDWDDKKWLDDALLTNVELLFDDKIVISGIIIWGQDNTTMQWTEPFRFQMNLNNSNEYEFLFGDSKLKELEYEKFLINREYWNKVRIDWRYKIKCSDHTPLVDNSDTQSSTSENG